MPLMIWFVKFDDPAMTTVRSKGKDASRGGDADAKRVGQFQRSAVTSSTRVFLAFAIDVGN